MAGIKITVSLNCAIIDQRQIAVFVHIFMKGQAVGVRVCNQVRTLTARIGRILSIIDITSKNILVSIAFFPLLPQNLPVLVELEELKAETAHDLRWKRK